MTSIADNVSRVREGVQDALRRAGREGDEVTIVAVTKTFGADVVRQVIDAGIIDIGENRVQEMLAKQDDVGAASCRWHLVGPLQRNKAGKVVGRVEMIHSVDSVRIAHTLDRLAIERGLRVRVLLEVNTSGEANKHGVSPQEAQAAGNELVGLGALDWAGLMTIGPLSGGESETRACFRTLAHLAGELRKATGRLLPVLSMGMSDDFEAAIEEGSTLVRVGRGITGERPPG
jgi:pyridoxal phosphate enzyme (YggS family)